MENKSKEIETKRIKAGKRN